MLLSMYNNIQKFIETISTVTGLDIEVVDNNLMRVAGTGTYNRDFGKSIINAGNLVQTTIKENKVIYVQNPRENELCHACKNKADCKELSAICMPIADENIVYGVIELACFDEQANIKLLQNAEIYINFLGFIASNIAESCKKKQELIDVSELLDVMFQVVHTTGKGCLIYDTNGKIIYKNTKAEDILKKLDLKQIKKEKIVPTGVVLSDMEEFSIEQKGKSINLLGKSVNLTSSTSKFDSIFVFDTIKSLLLPSFPTSPQQHSLDKIIGKSKAVQRLKQQIISTSKTQSTVLISGESGTGKELVARAVHSIGKNTDTPFIAVNCGAIPDTLLESELFGYVSGAFTGASPKGQIGKFEMAEGGILFLDEISCMPIYLQAKLLRALQEKTITRLGSNKNIKVNIRIIAATNDNLHDLMEKNLFRQDLYYRLNVIPIQIMPLRERMEDLDLLIAYFIEKYCTLFRKASFKLSERIILKMRNHSWPGNVRELENCIEYLVNMADEEGKINEENLYHSFLTPINSKVEDNSEKQFITLQEIEQEAIQKAIAHFGESTSAKKEVARVLGISLATLYRKLEA